MDKILANARTIDEILSDMIEPIIGDTPVSVQLSTALDGMARKEDIDALCAKLDEIRREVERLTDLVGDIPVSAQINMAIDKSEN